MRQSVERPNTSAVLLTCSSSTKSAFTSTIMVFFALVEHFPLHTMDIGRHVQRIPFVFQVGQEIIYGFLHIFLAHAGCLADIPLFKFRGKKAPA